MTCAKCRAELPAGSVFCNQCGASQVSSTAPTVSSSAPTVPEIARPAAARTQVPEEPVWKGRFSAKSFAHHWVIWAIYAAAVGYLPFAVPQIPRDDWMWYTLAGLVGLPALVILWMILVKKVSIRYRLTNYRLFVESGILSRSISEVELIRVDDVAVRQNLLQRLFNVGVVTVISTDATDPRLDIYGIADPVAVKEMIRSNVRERRARVVNLGQVG